MRIIYGREYSIYIYQYSTLPYLILGLRLRFVRHLQGRQAGAGPRLALLFQEPHERLRQRLQRTTHVKTSHE